MATVVAVFTVSGAPAAAQVCVPQQDVAALDQYCDALPTPAGPSEPLGPTRLRTRRPTLSAVLPAREVALLRKAGPEARALLLLPAIQPLGRGPSAAEQRRRNLPKARHVLASGKLNPRGDNIGTVVSGLASAGGQVVSGAFRWGLVLSTVGLAGLAWFRLRIGLRP